MDLNGLSPRCRNTLPPQVHTINWIPHILQSQGIQDKLTRQLSIRILISFHSYFDLTLSCHIHAGIQRINRILLGSIASGIEL